MPLNLSAPEIRELRPRITVFGVGGAGGNAVDNMIEKSLEGAEFVAANTDSQALQRSRADRRIQLGAGTTQGLGAGAKPEVGRQAAIETAAEIEAVLDGSHMCFITAGMGGGTGTGAAPIIAQKAREMGVLTVGVVTKPFVFEGSPRLRIAEAGIAELQQHVDTLIIIPNQNLFRVANENTTFAEAFVMADDVLYQGVKGVTDLIVRPGLVNLDFADVRAVMNEMGKAMMGSGESTGEGRALDAAEKAIANPLLDEVSLKGAKGVLINITGGLDMTLFEVDEAASRIAREADADAAVFFGSACDPEMEGKIRVSVVATGIDEAGVRARDAEPARPIVLNAPLVGLDPMPGSEGLETEGEMIDAPSHGGPSTVPHVDMRRSPSAPAPFVRSFQDEVDGAFETPRRFGDPSAAPRRAPARPTSGGPDGFEDPADSAANLLVRKMTGAATGSKGVDRAVSDDEIRRSIPAFLRRQPN